MAAVAASRHLNDPKHHEFDKRNNRASQTRTKSRRYKVALLSQREHAGGMCSGGLGESDVGSCAERVIGGLTKEFFLRSAQKYDVKQPRTPWNLEPHVAKQVFLDMLREANVTLLPFGEVETVVKNERGYAESITVPESIAPQESYEYFAEVFIDASYEGDLMARTPDVDYTWGRESFHKYRESGAGSHGQSRMGDFPVGVRIDPYYDGRTAVDGEDENKHIDKVKEKVLLHLLSPEPPKPRGQSDRQIQSYNFRLCVTNNETMRVPFTRPANYNVNEWELLRRFWHAWWRSSPNPNATDKDTTYNHWKREQAKVPTQILGQLPSSIDGYKKYDANNCGYNLVHTDMIGASWDYPEANYSHRRAIWQAHVDYTKGWLWTMSSDPSVPFWVRFQFRNLWGYCRDEFVDNDHFPTQLYVREARRLVGDRVFTQHDAQQQGRHVLGNASVGMGCYGFDSHCEERYACTDPEQCTTYKVPYVSWQCGSDVPDPGIYQMPMWVLFPKKRQVKNLLVPVCNSASHVAYSTLRMEPQFMMLGHASGVIAALTIFNDVEDRNKDRARATAVQAVDHNQVAALLLADGQILSLSNAPKAST